MCRVTWRYFYYNIVIYAQNTKGWLFTQNGGFFICLSCKRSKHILLRGKKLSNCVMWLEIHFAPQAYFSEQRALNLGFSQPGSHHHSVTASTGPVFGGRKWRGSSTTETVSTTELMMEWWLGLGGSAKRLMRGNRDEREPALSKASSRVDRAFFL